MNRAFPAVLLFTAMLFLLNPSGSSAAPDYEKGLKAAKSAIASGDHKTASSVLAGLNSRYPDNGELLAMHGRVLFWLKRYEEAAATLNRALTLAPSEALQKELQQAEAFRDIVLAESLHAKGYPAVAEAIVRRVFKQGTVRYEPGILLARWTYERGDFSEAAEIHREMLTLYPAEKDLRPRYAQSLLNTGREAEALAYIDSLADREQDPDLLAIKGRIHFRKGDPDLAAASFRGSVAIQPSAEITSELVKAEISRDLKKADVLLSSGNSQEAEVFLATLCARQELQYEACRRLASLSSKTGNHSRAASLYGRLAAAYPAEPDFRLLEAQELIHLQKSDEAAATLDRYPDQGNGTLLSLRGRIAMLAKKYDEAVSFYSRALNSSLDPDTGKRLNEARSSLALVVAGRHMAAREYQKAEPLLTELYKNGSDPYTAGLMLGRLLFATREYPRAAAHYRELEQRYPREPDLTALRMESHILAREYREAVQILRTVTPEVRDYIAREREDLLYRSTANWVRVSGGAAGYSGRSTTTESGMNVSVFQRFGQNSLTAWSGFTTRFGITDSQAGIEFSRGRGEKSPLWWNLFFSFSPDARILPRTTAGGEVTRGFEGYEASFGFTRMDFRNSGVNIIIPGALWYIPSTTFSLSERVYIVPETGGFTTLTTLHQEPDHRFRWFASLGAGTSSERISSRQDSEKFTSLSGRLGGEYRFTPIYSGGAEASFESREGLYDRTGGSLFMRYWWQ